MRFERLLEIVAAEPVFETGLLLAGGVDPTDVRRQLSRWTRAGRILQLRRGLYVLAPPYRRMAPHPFVVSNRLRVGSYVSCQAALAHYGLVPEHAPGVTAVSTGRTGRFVTPLGQFTFRHVKADLFHGYVLAPVGAGQEAFVALPEKALLDLVHLQPSGDSPAWLDGLRLQQLDVLDCGTLDRLAAASGSPKQRRAAEHVAALAAAEAEEYAPL